MDSKLLTHQTTAYYDFNATDFWEGTKDHDVTQNIKAFLSSIKAQPPFQILDFGCGPGRDLITFTALGHHATGLDGSKELCRLAREKSGCKILNQDFIDLNLPPLFFDGVFANASLFHAPKVTLPKVLLDLAGALKEGGVLFSSNPRGSGESFNEARYANFMEFPEYETFLKNAGFKVISHYYRPQGLPLVQQPWLATVSHKQ